MEICSKSIKSKAVEIGFHKVGISKAISTPNERDKLAAWISEGKNASMKWLSNRKDERGDIHKYFKSAKSVISVGINFWHQVKQGECK